MPHAGQAMHSVCQDSVFADESSAFMFATLREGPYCVYRMQRVCGVGTACVCGVVHGRVMVAGVWVIGRAADREWTGALGGE